MSDQPRWWSRTALKLHVALLAGLALCAVASWVEWRRALDGHLVAWAYAFEWPLFAMLGLWVWWRLLHERPLHRERRPSRRRARATIGDDDPGLVAWRAYLADLHAADLHAADRSEPGGRPGASE